MQISRIVISFCFFWMCTISVQINGQTINYSQFNFETSLSRVIKDKWSSELVLSETTSSLPGENGMFDLQSSFSIAVWGHYHVSPKYQLSGQAGLYFNRNVPDLNQEESTEYRFTPQLIYFFNRAGYILSTRGRPELRYIVESGSTSNVVVRYRQQLRLLVPFNSRVVRPGVVYGIVADEIYLKSKSNISGDTFFDRNRLTLGLGYAFSELLQARVSYINEQLPRSEADKSYDIFKVTLIFTNLLDEFRNTLRGIHDDTGNGNED
jgi:hypothetical protein